VTAQAPKPDKPPQRGAKDFAIFLATGLVWLVIGGFAGRYLYPEFVEREVITTVEKVVTQRVEVPVDRIVYRDVIKEVVKTVEVPVEKIVIKEIAVPVPMKPQRANTEPAPEGSPWDFIRNGMSKSDVTAVLGDPSRVYEEDDKVTWYYDEKGQGALFVRFKVGGLFGADKVDLWLAPDRRPVSKANAGARLQGMARQALEDGNAPLALVYAQAALAVEPDSGVIKELVRDLLAKVSAQTAPR
jgi:hypothetical protein